MIQIKGNDIYISKGDTLAVEFQVNGYQIQQSDTIIFSVKSSLGSSDVLLKNSSIY